jgi:hypothetical protein
MSAPKARALAIHRLGPQHAAAAAGIVGHQRVEMTVRLARPQIIAEGDARTVAVFAQDAADELVRRVRTEDHPPMRTLSVPTGRLLAASITRPL